MIDRRIRSFFYTVGYFHSIAHERYDMAAFIEVLFVNHIVVRALRQFSAPHGI